MSFHIDSRLMSLIIQIHCLPSVQIFVSLEFQKTLTVVACYPLPTPGTLNKGLCIFFLPCVALWPNWRRNY